MLLKLSQFKRYNLFHKIKLYEFELGKASDGNTVVNHSNTDPKIKGLNPATDCHLDKMAEKQINILVCDYYVNLYFLFFNEMAPVPGKKLLHLFTCFFDNKISLTSF
jgi:hypothetical protein